MTDHHTEYSQATGWQIVRADGTRTRWTGLHTGPEVLDAAVQRTIVERLLGLRLEGVTAAAAQLIRPATDHPDNEPWVILHSATPVLRPLEADIADLTTGRRPEDTTAYLETRAVSLARPGDLVVARLKPALDAAGIAGLEKVVIPDLDHYYLSHAILRLADRTAGRAAPIRRLAEALRLRPRTVIRVYSLDLEMQAILLLLAKLANLAVVRVDANSPEISDVWNAKAPLHPIVDDAEAIDSRSQSPEMLLAEESALTPLARDLGVLVPRLPGYTIDPHGSTGAEVTRDYLTAARLLMSRYGLTRGCLKPSGSGAGQRIVAGLPLADEGALSAAAQSASEAHETFVLEAHVEYEAVRLGNCQLPLVPSAHVRWGDVVPSLTLQIMNGHSWQGNVLIDDVSCTELGLDGQQYAQIQETMGTLRAGFASRNLALVTAGVDFAIGRIGGFFGTSLLLAVQDLNLSSHGAEYLRSLLDQLSGENRHRYGATRVIRPVRRAELVTLRALNPSFEGAQDCKVICTVPGVWGMIAASGDSPATALKIVLDYERFLADGGLIDQMSCPVLPHLRSHAE